MFLGANIINNIWEDAFFELSLERLKALSAIEILQASATSCKALCVTCFIDLFFPGWWNSKSHFTCLPNHFFQFSLRFLHFWKHTSEVFFLQQKETQLQSQRQRKKIEEFLILRKKSYKMRRKIYSRHELRLQIFTFSSIIKWKEKCV